MGTIEDFPCGSVFKIWPPNAEGAGSISACETKIPHASLPKNQNIEQKQSCNKFSKYSKNGPC